MSIASGIYRVLFGGPKVNGELKYKPEIRTPFEDPDIQRLLPEGYRIEFVKHSQSNLVFDPDHWEVGTFSDLTVHDNDLRFSIEVMSRYGKPVAAVGWYFHPARTRFDTAYTIGTFVAKHLRRRGLGKALWRAMIRVCGVPHVDGCAATDEGYTLLRSMKEAFPDTVSFEGDQPLSDYEDLRKKGRAA